MGLKLEFENRVGKNSLLGNVLVYATINYIDLEKAGFSCCYLFSAFRSDSEFGEDFKYIRNKEDRKSFSERIAEKYDLSIDSVVSVLDNISFYDGIPMKKFDPKSYYANFDVINAGTYIEDKDAAFSRVTDIINHYLIRYLFQEIKQEKKQI